jgi:hypothetical protein
MKALADMTEFELRFYTAHLEDRIKLATKRANDFSNMKRAKSSYNTVQRLRSEIARCKKQLKALRKLDRRMYEAELRNQSTPTEMDLMED